MNPAAPPSPEHDARRRTASMNANALPDDPRSLPPEARLLKRMRALATPAIQGAGMNNG